MNFKVKKIISRSCPYVIIVAVCLVLYLFLAYRIPAVRTGDGSEYYCNFLSFQKIHRPWMEKASFDRYENLISSQTIQALPPRKWLENAFPDLRVRNTSDFNHFWFYSFLAYIVYECFRLIGIVLSPHNAFLMLHCILFGAFSTVCFYYYRWRGLLGAVLFLIGTPLLWNIAYVHTEFFTFTLSLMAIVFLMNSKYLVASLALAAASTQNPPFAIIAFLPFVYHFIRNWGGPFSLTDVIVIVATGFLTMLHPVYYFFRYGVLSPQFLAGGAALGENLRYWYVYLFDPDLGLIFQWPLGLVILLFLCLFCCINRHQAAEYIRTHKFLICFIALFLVVCLYGQASTTNLNSGACISIQRYALWYVPLFFAPFLFLLSWLLKFSKWSIPLGIVMFFCVVANVFMFFPCRPENHVTPTRISFLIQKYLPGLYNPPPEVFVERYSGLGESPEAHSLRIILGPDRYKALINPHASGVPYPAAGIGSYNKDKLNQLLDHLSVGKKSPFYIFLSDKQIENLRDPVPLNRDISACRNMLGCSFLSNGWSLPEGWGTWTNGKQAKICIPYTPKQAYYGKPALKVKLHFHAFYKKQRLQISLMRKELYSGQFKGDSSITFLCPLNDVHAKKQNAITLKLKIPDAVVPCEVMKSTDTRRLGVCLHSIRLELPR